MPLNDYAHWNEDAYFMWWQEEGRFGSEPPDYDPDDYLPGDEHVQHDTPDECIADGNFSTKDGVTWFCDGCEGDTEFEMVPDEDPQYAGTIRVKP